MFQLSPNQFDDNRLFIVFRQKFRLRMMSATAVNRSTRSTPITEIPPSF